MRGKVIFSFLAVTGNRITPAYAGKSYAARFLGLDVEGSPPPMRGKDGVDSIPQDSDRITPAYAGKSFQKQSYNCIA